MSTANPEWITVERPGYFGSHRAAKNAEYDQRFGGSEFWRLAWDVSGHAFTREQMNMLYEDSYFEFLRVHADTLETLVSEASDVYDDALTNINSGFDYSLQETERTHVQDIAIRRAVSRLGRVFAGARPMQIRDTDGEHELSQTLSPGQIPFHLPQLILTPELTGWWLSGSVESFYQSNKLLQRRA